MERERPVDGRSAAERLTAERLNIETQRCIAIAVVASGDVAAMLIDEAVRLNRRAEQCAAPVKPAG
jgi:hypothetical protein